MNVSVRSLLSNQALDQEMEYWKQVDFSTGHINVFSMQKDIYFHSQALQREFDNQFNKFAVKLLNGKEMVGHLPGKYSRIASYFLAHGGSISVKVSCHRQHYKELNRGGMEIPC